MSVSERLHVEDRLVDAVQSGQVLDLSKDSDRTVRATVIRDLLCGKRAVALDPRGLRLRGAEIVGKLDLTDVRSSFPLALTACRHNDCIFLTRSHLPSVDLTDSWFPGLEGDDFVCEHDTVLLNIQTKRVSLIGANISGRLRMSGAKLHATEDPALVADGLAVGGDLFMNGDFVANSNSDHGVLRLPGTDVGGEFTLSGACLTAINGPAIHADRLTVGAGMFLTENFSATSESSLGVIRLPGANIKNQLVLNGARLTAINGPAIHADGVAVDDDLLLNEEFSASSDSSLAVLRFPDAGIAGKFSLAGSSVNHSMDSGITLDARTTRVGGDLSITLQSFSTSEGPSFQVNVDGLRYQSIDVSCDEWLNLLKLHTPSYASQPYQQFAAVLRSAGHDEETRRTLIAQQQDRRRRGYLGRRKLFHLASGMFIGYGYRPGRALWFLLATCIIATAGTIVASLYGLIAHTGNPSESCTIAESIGFAINTEVPFLKGDGAKHCAIMASRPAGGFLFLASYALQALGWSSATLFVAGYSGLVRKNL